MTGFDPNHWRVHLMLSPSVLHRVKAATHVCVFTGAGISAESGIPTFRERSEGLWAKHDPMEVATPEAYKKNPQLVWDWHVHLAEKVRQASPNAGHQAVAKLQALVPKVTVITQNVDNLHQDAGSCDVLELHGSLFRLTAFVDKNVVFSDEQPPVICHLCKGYAVWEQCDHFADRSDLEELKLATGRVPRCPACGAFLRPDIVWFGEMLNPQVLEGAMDAADTCDVLICVGSSLEVEPAASLPYRALRRGAVVVEINPVPTALSAAADASLIGKAGDILPRLLSQVWGIKVG